MNPYNPYQTHYPPVYPPPPSYWPLPPDHEPPRPRWGRFLVVVIVAVLLFFGVSHYLGPYLFNFLSETVEKAREPPPPWVPRDLVPVLVHFVFPCVISGIIIGGLIRLARKL